MDRRLNTVWWTLRVGLGLAAFLAGADKFTNLLVNWTTYLNPLATRVVPLSGETFMHIVGVIEMIVGLAILTRWTRYGSWVAMIWLLGIAANLVTMARFDIAVRDVEMALAAFSLARITEVREEAGVAREEERKVSVIAPRAA